MPSWTVLNDVSLPLAPVYPNTHFLFSFYPVPCSSFFPTFCLLCPGLRTVTFRRQEGALQPGCGYQGMCASASL